MTAWKKPEENRILGKRLPRLDAAIKVTGQAKYTYDINLPGLLYGRLISSPHAAATIKSIDTSVAEKMPGVKAVIMTAKPGDTVRFHGQELGALCAASSDLAEDALRAIKIEYQVLPHVVTEEAAMKPGAPQVLPDTPNVFGASVDDKGDVAAAFKDAAATVEGRYYMAVRTHACLETHGVTIRWDDDSHITCWASTQGVTGVQSDLQRTFNLPGENVKVITEVMGGGFGSKFGLGYEGRLCAQLAKQTKAPVKMMLTRAEDQLSAGNAPSAIGEVKMAADKEGKITAIEGRVYSSGGVGFGGVPFPYIYNNFGNIPNVKVRREQIKMNTSGARAWRAPGHPQGSWIMECALEDLAVKIGMDPLQMRIKNDGNKIRQKQWLEGAKLIGWERRNEKPGVGTLAGTGRFRRGIGCAASIWGGGGGGAGSECRVMIHKDGRVWVGIGVQDIGTGARTITRMIVAEELGLPMNAVQESIGKSELGPAAGSGGSQTSASISPVIKTAAEAAKSQLLEIVAAKKNLNVNDLDLLDGNVVVKSDASKNIAFKDACALMDKESLTGNGKFDRSLVQAGVAGAQFLEVEVDVLTGCVKVLKAVNVQDGGVILNPLTMESQMNGGVIQGLSTGLYEDRHMCSITGRMLNPNLEEYKIPGTKEMPEFIPMIYTYPEAKGVSGIAESTNIPTAPAIRNAILNATGAHVNEAPMTPARVLTALAEARKRGTNV